MLVEEEQNNNINNNDERIQRFYCNFLKKRSFNEMMCGFSNKESNNEYSNNMTNNINCNTNPNLSLNMINSCNNNNVIKQGISSNSYNCYNNNNNNHHYNNFMNYNNSFSANNTGNTNKTSNINNTSTNSKLRYNNNINRLISSKKQYTILNNIIKTDSIDNLATSIKGINIFGKSSNKEIKEFSFRKKSKYNKDEEFLYNTEQAEALKKIEDADKIINYNKTQNDALMKLMFG